MNAVLFVLIELVLGVAVLLLSRKAPDQRRERTRSLWAYVVFCAMALPPFLLLPLGHNTNIGFFAAVAMATWILLGALWVVRRNPQVPNPDWVRRPWWIPDWTLVAIAALCLWVVFYG